jgi:ABC-type antimicrobial peptide transport system permease subunit
MLLILIGASVGFVGGLGAARLLKRVLFSVDPSEPVTLGFAILALVTVGLLACLIPARSAARIDPIVALRYD